MGGQGCTTTDDCLDLTTQAGCNLAEDELVTKGCGMCLGLALAQEVQLPVVGPVEQGALDGAAGLDLRVDRFTCAHDSWIHTEYLHGDAIYS